MKEARCMVDQPGRSLPFLQGSQARLDFCALRRLFQQCRKCPQHPECGLVEEFNQAVQIALDKFSAEFRRNTAVPPQASPLTRGRHDQPKTE